MKSLRYTFLLLAASLSANAQTLTDGLFMSRNDICVGVQYNHDSWNRYWEGALLRSNDNIGTLTTQSAVLMANYGLLKRLNVIAMAPFVWTKASQGTLAPQRGIQDLTIGIKYKLLELDWFGGKFSAQAVGGLSTPLSNYVADYLPLSIGLRSSTVFGRGMLYYIGPKHLSLTLGGAYIRRSNIEIDRESYYTTRLVNSSEVEMYDVFHLHFRGGYYRYRWSAEASFEQFSTLGGFDIRGQDMPFPSNNMDATRIGVSGFYRLPFLADIQAMGTVSQVIAGRNMGKSTTFSIGFTKFFSL